jgi:hypothetical protein
MKFKKSYETWLAQHRKYRTGERRAQLDRRDHHGEMLLLQNVLIPTLGSFTHLHPEYELNILGARTMFLDITYVNPPLLIDFELDGYDYHANKISREQFAYERKRDILLKLEGWHVLRFAYDDVKENPAHLRQLVRRFMEKFAVTESQNKRFNIYEREVIKLALARPLAIIKMQDVLHVTQLSPMTARKMMRKLVSEDVFITENANAKRCHFYKLNNLHPNIQSFVY